ncbi:MAG: MaoC/PaaZ C-terminal domain-containing protein [Paracoccaceae bacterium]
MRVDKVLGYAVKGGEVSWTGKDAILYALGVNLGRDPLNRGELAYLFEKDMKVLPGFAMVLGHPGFWMREPQFGIDWVKIVHAEQFLETSRPIPSSGTARVDIRVTGIVDKGADKGAIVYYEKTLSDAATGAEIARVTTGAFCRGDGGCGDHGVPPSSLAATPERAPDRSVTREIDLRAALIYRLSGDFNPLHIDPETARQAGYERPILHGLCTMGLANHVLVEEMAGGDPERFKGFACRFSRPVYPGDKLRVDIWNEDGGARWRVVSETSGQVVLDRGRARV